jgi:dipeptidyl aminopeptidase/acylaminoacyl peptidase
VSHDGKRVVYQRGEWTVNRFTDNLYTARIDGTHVQRLAASDEWEGDPNWSPHDDWIVFESSADRGGRYTVYVVESNGGTRTRVMSRHGCCADWTERVAGQAGARAAGATTSLDSAPLRSPGARRRLREMHEHALAEQRPVRGAVLVDATTSRDGDISASADSFAANYRRRAGR